MTQQILKPSMLAPKILQELKTHASDPYWLTAITIHMEADTIAY
jgi:hypothetical protein